MIFPLAVILKRLAAPRWVFSFFFGFFEFLGITKILSAFLRVHRLQNPLHITTCLSGAQQCCAPTKKILCRLRGLLRTWFCCWCALFWGQPVDQDRGLHWRHGFNLAVLADFAQQARHLGTAHFLVRHFATAMKNHGAHFMAFPQEANDLILANLVIVLRGGRPKLYFLELRATTALALLMRLFVLLVKEFAIVGDLANRRICGGRNFHQIESPFARHTNCFVRLHHSKLGTLLINHPDFARPNPLIYAGAVALPEAAFCDISP